MLDDIQYGELIHSIMAGCEDYLIKRANEWWIESLLFGARKEALTRASDALDLASKISPGCEDEVLLSLLKFIFDTKNSPDFGLCVAKYLFQGTKTKRFDWISDDELGLLVEGEMSSSVFSKKAVDFAIGQNSNYDGTHYNDDGAATHLEINKCKCAESILRSSFFKQSDMPRSSYQGGIKLAPSPHSGEPEVSVTGCTMK